MASVKYRLIFWMISHIPRVCRYAQSDWHHWVFVRWHRTILRLQHELHWTTECWYSCELCTGINGYCTVIKYIQTTWRWDLVSYFWHWSCLRNLRWSSAQCRNSPSTSHQKLRLNYSLPILLLIKISVTSTLRTGHMEVLKRANMMLNSSILPQSTILLIAHNRLLSYRQERQVVPNAQQQNLSSIWRLQPANLAQLVWLLVPLLITAPKHQLLHQRCQSLLLQFRRHLWSVHWILARLADITTQRTRCVTLVQEANITVSKSERVFTVPHRLPSWLKTSAKLAHLIPQSTEHLIPVVDQSTNWI